MKKKGLLVWFEMDKRPELLQPFVDMSDEVEFIHLNFRTREERDVNLSPFKVIYWFDYKTPWQLLREHKPDFIAGGTEGSLLMISLVVAAAEKNIPYYGLQHGFSVKNIVQQLVPGKRENIFSASSVKKYYRTSRFYFSSLQLKTLGRVFQYIKLYALFFTKVPEQAIIRNRYQWLKPPCYICFSEISGLHYKDLYHLQEEQMRYVGIPCADSLFKQLNLTAPALSKEKYFLLIDTCFVDYYKPVSAQQVRRCYQALLEYCRDNNAKLYVKLHPRNYSNYNLAYDPAITWIRNVPMPELAGLIINAAGCFGFYSTLTIPIAFTIPTIQIGYDEVYDEFLAESGIIPLVDFYTFQKTDLVFNNAASTDPVLKKRFLFSTDGKAGERIKQILLS